MVARVPLFLLLETPSSQSIDVTTGARSIYSKWRQEVPATCGTFFSPSSYVVPQKRFPSRAALAIGPNDE